MAAPIPEEKHGADCNVPNGCNRVVPGWIIFLDNAPTGAVFILGTAIVWQVGALPALLFFAYCLLSIVIFWHRICPWCQHFGNWGCPCGYGRIAHRLFVKKSGREFRTIFRRNIFVVLPCWLVPLGIGLHEIGTGHGRTNLYLLPAFCIIGFVLVPAVSRFAGCRSCTMRLQCPWIFHAGKK
jgi:hypothetical protein